MDPQPQTEEDKTVEFANHNQRLQEAEYDINEMKKVIRRQSQMIWQLEDWLKDQNVRLDANTAKLQFLSEN